MRKKQATFVLIQQFSAMKGETNLEKLIEKMSPELHPGEYVFVSVPDHTPFLHASPLGFFREKEGSTMILKREKADALGLPYDFAAAWITLNVHSDLSAVGLTAAFSSELAKQGISCNVVAGYYHDHLFVSGEDGQRALETLMSMAPRTI